MVVAGTDRVVYSYPTPSHGGSWKQHLLAELDGQLDLPRLHFTGLLNYGDYIRMQQRSDLHVIFSRPYVTSWGLFQAAACGARLLLNREPGLRSVVLDDQAIWVDLDQPQPLQAAALQSLDQAMKHRSQPRVSFLKPEWEIRTCLQRW